VQWRSKLVSPRNSPNERLYDFWSRLYLHRQLIRRFLIILASAVATDWAGIPHERVVILTTNFSLIQRKCTTLRGSGETRCSSCHGRYLSSFLTLRCCWACWSDLSRRVGRSGCQWAVRLSCWPIAFRSSSGTVGKGYYRWISLLLSPPCAESFLTMGAFLLQIWLAVVVLV